MLCSLFTWAVLILYLQNDNSRLHTGDGSVDVHGDPAVKEKTGTWKACPFILGNISRVGWILLERFIFVLGFVI